MSGTTWELTVAFAGEAAAAVKTAARAVIAASGLTAVVDGYVDGVDHPVDGDLDGSEGDGGGSGSVVSVAAPGGAGWFEAGLDATPLLVYDSEPDRLRRLSHELITTFGDRVDCRLGTISDESWTAAWTESEASTLATRRFAIVPEGGSAADGRIALRLAAGAAFGDGRHATTLAALMALEHLDAGRCRGPCLDAGTGNGILAVAAGHLGFDPLVATEIDGTALDEARRNALANGIRVEALLTDAVPVRPGGYSLIVANILAPVLHALMPGFAAQLQPSGRLILAGFVAKEAEPLIALAARHNLVLAGEHECRGWLGLTFQRGAPHLPEPG